MRMFDPLPVIDHRRVKLDVHGQAFFAVRVFEPLKFHGMGRRVVRWRLLEPYPRPVVPVGWTVRRDFVRKEWIVVPLWIELLLRLYELRWRICDVLADRGLLVGRDGDCYSEWRWNWPQSWHTE